MFFLIHEEWIGVQNKEISIEMLNYSRDLLVPHIKLNLHVRVHERISNWNLTSL